MGINAFDEVTTRHVVVIGEKSRGNEKVGDMWLETTVFPSDISVKEILRWAKKWNVTGNLILTIPDERKGGEA